MAARRSTTWTGEWERGLRRLERQLPAPVRRMLRDLAKSLRDAQRQLEAARKDRDQRWRKLQKELRGDAGRLVRQLERAVMPRGAQKTRRARPRRRRARRSASAG
jgi:malate synthase